MSHDAYLIQILVLSVPKSLARQDLLATVLPDTLM